MGTPTEGDIRGQSSAQASLFPLGTSARLLSWSGSLNSVPSLFSLSGPTARRAVCVQKRDANLSLARQRLTTGWEVPATPEHPGPSLVAGTLREYSHNKHLQDADTTLGGERALREDGLVEGLGDSCFTFVWLLRLGEARGVSGSHSPA